MRYFRSLLIAFLLAISLPAIAQESASLPDAPYDYYFEGESSDEEYPDEFTPTEDHYFESDFGGDSENFDTAFDSKLDAVASVMIQLPVDNSGYSLVDWSSIEFEHSPAFGSLIPSMDGCGFEYVPQYEGITYDAFVFSCSDIFGQDELIGFVQLDGETGHVTARFTSLAAWGAGGEDKIHWHHELPQSVFVKNGCVVDGIDQDFIDQQKYGHIFRPVDHTHSGGIHWPINEESYNKQWKDWLDTFETKYGRKPTISDVEKNLVDMRNKYAHIYERGIKANVNYKDWPNVLKETKYKIRKKLVLRAKKLAQKAAKEAAENAAKKSGKIVGKKIAKQIPFLGVIVAVGCGGGRVWAGEPFGEVLVDETLDAIPFVGAAKGIYEVGQVATEAGGVIIDVINSEPTEEEIYEEIWEELSAEPTI